MNNRLTALIVAFILVVGSSAYAGFRSSSQGSGTYTPPAGVTPNPLGDTDGDGTADITDTDDDNDGVPDVADAFPLDANESLDTDSDGIGNNADTDDDGDLIADGDDAFPLDATQSIEILATADITTSCSENTCTVSGQFPLGASLIAVTGTHASASAQTLTDSSGGNFSVTFSGLQAGDWTFAVSTSNTIHTLQASAPQGASASLAQAIAEAIADPSSRLSPADITNSMLPDQLKNDLLTQGSCGANGTSDCLAWFNDLTATTTCTAVTADSSDMEIETYVNCALHEGYVALINAAVIPTPEPIVSGCSSVEPITFGLPRLCSTPHITCSIDGAPASWIVNSAETGITVPTSYITGASATTVNATVGMTLAPRYNISTYFNRVPQTYNVIETQAGVDSQGRLLKVVTSGRANPISAQRTCRNLGGELANSTEFDAFATNISTYGWLMFHPTNNDEDLSWGAEGNCPYRNGGDDRCVARDGAYGAERTDCAYSATVTVPHPQYGAYGVTIQQQQWRRGFFWDRQQRVTQQYCSTSQGTSGGVGWNDSIAFLCTGLPRCE